MKVEILEFIEGARQSCGAAVIIDVFRAFSTACYAFDAGAVRLIATNEPEKAFLLKKSYRQSVLTGERDEKKIEGFDFGNSPTEIIKHDLTGYTVIQTTTAGTNGLLAAVNADTLLAGSLVNAGAIINYLKVLAPPSVSLVAMGYRASMHAAEDLLCAEIIKAGLNGEEKDFAGSINGLRHGAGKRFFDPENIDFSPPTDYFLCTMLNRFDFILKGERRDDGNIDLVKIDL
ncbi:MAG TPA: 2-phosphosulfolactate phosphatase [Bacteroidales bacterium]|nr:2-phosphosulfolactate phosphatase [Bacteroidales bacterium]